MPIFPYDDEEERRRRMLTPGINPNAPPPNIPTSRPLPPPGIPGGAPSGGMLGPGPIEPPAPALTRGSQMYNARADYLQDTPGRGKSALKGALQGFLSGGGLAGAATGGIYGATDPRELREMEFNQKVRPKLLERFAYEDQDRAAQRQGQEAAIEGEYKQAQIGALNRSNLPAPPKPPGYSSAAGLGIYNDQTGQITTPAPPPQPRELAPRPVVNDRGDYVDFNAETKAGRKVKAFQKPKAAPKEKAEPKVVSIDDVREAVKKAGGHAAGWTKSRMKAEFIRKGYRITE